MGNLSADPDLGDNPLEQRFFVGDARRDELERHRLPQFHVLGAIDLARPTRSQRRDDPISRVQDVSGRKLPCVLTFRRHRPRVRERPLIVGRRCYRVVA